jgi:hypothetical protein
MSRQSNLETLMGMVGVIGRASRSRPSASALMAQGTAEREAPSARSPQGDFI